MKSKSKIKLLIAVFLILCQCAVCIAKEEKYVRLMFKWENGKITLVKQRKLPGKPQKKRKKTPSPNEFVIKGLDSSGKDIFKSIISDPSILFTDTAPSPEAAERGELTGEIKKLDEAYFIIEMPYDKNTKKIQVVKLLKGVYEGKKFKKLKDFSQTKVKIE